MRRAVYLASLAAVATIALLCAHGAAAAESHVLLSFAEDPARAESPWPCGVFRAEDPPNYQYVEDHWVRLPTNGERSLGFLALVYNVSGAGSSNGWWVKLDGRVRDWTKYADGELVFLLRRLAPEETGPLRTVRLDQPDTEALTKLKIELKTKTDDGAVRTAGLRQRLSERHLQEQQQQGYFELRVPFRDFALDLRRPHELVLVFENAHLLPAERRGGLALHAVALTTRPGVPLPVGEPPADELIDELGRQALDWFVKHRHPVSGQVLDRAPNQEMFRPDPDQPAMSSVASTGYYLSLLSEYVRLGRLTRDEASAQAAATLRFVRDHVEHRHGMCYHFVDWRTGQRWDNSEVSCLDTAILLNGAATAGIAFQGEVGELADALIDRAEWPRFLVMQDGKQFLSLGWSPERGLLGPADVRSSEMAMMYFLAAGSRSHPIAPQCWYNTRVEYVEAAGIRLLQPTVLFTAYYGLNWHDLSSLVDAQGVDLWANATASAKANRAFCRREARRFETYSGEHGGWWGISAGDAPTGYIAPELTPGDADGIVWPTTALAALPFLPEQIQSDVARWRNQPLWEHVSGPYGLAPFRIEPGANWRGSDLIGIDLGSFAVSWANYRHRTVWDLWMQHEVARRALSKLQYRRH